MTNHEKFMTRAITLAENNIKKGGGPFGAVIVKDNKIIAEGYNQVTNNNDPTAHAEVTAIREASKILETFDLSGCTIYTSCEPCPMCLGAIYWAKLDKIYYGNTKQDADNIGFSDAFIYKEIERPIHERNVTTQQLMHKEALTAFKMWKESDDKISY